MQTHKATVQLELGSGITLTHETEFIAEDETDAHEKGVEFARKVAAFNAGFAEAHS
jgi:hypothetical protein